MCRRSSHCWFTLERTIILVPRRHVVEHRRRRDGGRRRAIPGLIDLVSLPGEVARAGHRHPAHAAFNVLALALFAISAVMLYRNAVTLNPARGNSPST